MFCHILGPTKHARYLVLDGNEYSSAKELEAWPRSRILLKDVFPGFGTNVQRFGSALVYRNRDRVCDAQIIHIRKCGSEDPCAFSAHPLVP